TTCRPAGPPGGPIFFAPRRPGGQKNSPDGVCGGRPSRLAAPLVKERVRRGRWFLGPPGPPATATSGPQEVTTSQITVGVHIGWITSLSRRGPTRGPGPIHLAAGADSRRKARSRCSRPNYREER